MAENAPNTQEHSKRRVSYYYDADIGNYYYGQGHVMKPQRVRMTHTLLQAYGLYQKMDVFRPFPASFDAMTGFHTPEYINFLEYANEGTPDDVDVKYFNIGEDCPIFDGLYEFCQTSVGGSLAAAVKLNKQKTDIAINWMGGLHHAKKSEASGFCYTNDIVLGILELLKYHQRVLYVDIDVHHGDGVEEAFYTADRVMTVSFHQHGDFFPGTGALSDIGVERGRLYSLNVPLRDGITDHSYQSIFQPVMAKVMEKFQPDAIVLQCGADSIIGDKLGEFNLTLKGHGQCVSFLRSYNVPMMMLGGGGYTMRNVARCWTYETALALDKQISNELPYNDYYNYFGPDHQLHLQPSTAHNSNTREFLRKLTLAVFRNLDAMDAAPSVQMQPIEDDSLHSFDDLSLQQDMADPDVRLHHSIMDSVTDDQGEFFDGETEGEDRRNEHNAKEAEDREEKRKLKRAKKVKKAKIDDYEEEKKGGDGMTKEQREELQRFSKMAREMVGMPIVELEETKKKMTKEEKEMEEKRKEKEYMEKKRRAKEMDEKRQREKEEKAKKELREKNIRALEELKKKGEEKEEREREEKRRKNKEREEMKETVRIMQEKVMKEFEEKETREKEMVDRRKIKLELVENEEEEEEMEEERNEVRVKTEKISDDESSTRGPSTNTLLIEPTDILFGASNGERRRISITNLSGERKLIKMKCSNVMMYQFDPVYRIIDAGDNVKIRVCRRTILAMDERAVIVVVPCEDANEDPSVIFKRVPADEQEKYTIRLRVHPTRGGGGRGTAEQPMEIY